MNTLTRPVVTLRAETAAEVMTPNLVSLPVEASLRDALVLFTEKGFSAAPVIDASGRPVGVLSQSDVIVHDREQVNYLPEFPDYYRQADLTTRGGERLRGFQVENVDRTRVGDLMTPAVFSVRVDTPTAMVLEHLLALNVHRLFVVDRTGVLVGVISALDIVRNLRPDIAGSD
jgi:CBS domain-containing protein